MPERSVNAVEIAAGQPASTLRDLYEEFHPPLLGYLRACDFRAYEDLAADTWLKVASGLPTFEGDRVAFRSWLFTIARCRLMDHRRKVGRRREVVDLDALTGLTATDDPEAETVSAISGEVALRAIGALSADQADAVLLRIVADLSTEEVAEIMGKRPGTVRVLQHRALRRLAQVLDRRM
jgi:RNA polymerase sigma-70 factor (ECF subfamily)